jgi:hypothetical protein
MRVIVCLSVLFLAVNAFAQQGGPKPLVKTSIPPVRVVRREDGAYFIDFGRAAFAQFKLQMKLPADNKVAVRLGEKRAGPDRLDAKPGGSIRFLQTTIADGLAVLPKRDARLMPARVGPVMPYRYAELVGLPDGTTTESITKAVSQIAVNYPFNDDAAEFVSSDEQLNAVWRLCKY